MLVRKKILAYALIGTMMFGSFVPVQSVHADTTVETKNESEAENETTPNQDSTVEENSEKNNTKDENSEKDDTQGGNSEKNDAQEENSEKDAVQEEGLKDSEKEISQLSPITAKVVLLDPGHCSVHPGAKGNGLREEVAVLDITEACLENLKNYGDITVYMTREDGSCCRNLELGECLIARNNYAKILDADFLVSMHLNAGKTTGANVLAAYESGYNDEIRVETQKFGKIALRKLGALGIANRGLLLRKSGSGNRYNNGSLADYYSIVRNGVVQKIPSVIIEHGYISSSSDVSRFFNTSAKRAKVGKADAKAIVSYYGLKKKVISGEWKEIEGSIYYETSKGKKVTGWIKEDEKWYYFDENTGKMHTGFLEYDGEKVFLAPSTGEMVTGWFEMNGATYLAKGNGAIVRNDIHSDGINTYLFDSNGKQAKKGFRTVNGATYYVDKARHVISGVIKVNGKYYGMDPETKQQLRGYQNLDGKYYYFDEKTGAAVTKKIVKIDGKSYYFGSKGARTSGWVKYKGKKYYFAKNGVMAKGWKKIKNHYYYFNKSNGKMQTSKWIDNYYVNSKGIRTKKRK